jgi:peptidoglycan/xylan/chitin deacetylase (PgdA/CDA1 family)/2-polyprenyl-3-methyl-5-hydroxy-6-metoxy-1,4-benzoquinol methylase
MPGRGASGKSQLNPPAVRPAVDFDIRRPDPAAIPSDTEQVRLQLRYRGRKLGKLDLRRVPGLGWDELIERWIREEGQPRLLPRFLCRNAWRDRRLLAHLARLAVERRTLRYLWAMLHISPGLWPGKIRAYVVARQDALLPAKGAARRRQDAVQVLRQNVWDRVKWESLFTVPDPWAYSSPYEQRKYEQTLELLPEGRLNRVLELACAEGHFTVQLAPRVGGLLAADIAAPAIERARDRCRTFDHVSFQQLDMRRDPIPGRFELIVCSEVLYYIGNRFALARFARKVAAALEPGGHLLTTHAHAVVDDPTATGFDWQVGFGGKHIGEAIARVPGMELVRELRTPVYRVQLFRRSTGPTPRRQLPRELVEQQTADVGDLASAINWGGCAITRTEAANAWVTRALPILMYHRVAEDGPAELAPYRVAPALFERQLAYLRRHGYRTITVEEWLQVLAEQDGRIDDRVVALTFDDAYRDFITDAWPLLRKYGFSATVYVATDHVGGHAEWDRAPGEAAPIMSWHELRALAGEGLAIGAHSGAHPFMTQLAPADMLAEGRRSKERLERELGRPVVTMAYPYGDNDLLVRRAMAACGFAGAVTTVPGLSRLGDNPMAIPRQLVDGTDDLDRFIAKLGRPERATLDRRARYRYVRWAGENLM